jgi:chromosome segregation ATPase
MSENLLTTKEKAIRIQYAETRLEQPIWDCLCSILKDPENVIPKLEEYTFKSAVVNPHKRIAEAEEQIKLYTRKRGRISLAFTNGGFTEKEYQHELSNCNSRIAEFTQQIAKFRQLLVKQTERKDRDEILRNLYQKVKARLENASYEDKQFIVHLFIERINLFHKSNYAEVVFRFPATTNVMLNSVNKISKENDLYLVLHVKTLSQRERSRNLLIANPGMYHIVKTVPR